MPLVHFPNDLQHYTGGLDKLFVEAPRVQELFLALAQRFPGMGEELDKLAVAVNDEIHNDAPYMALDPDTEVYLIPRIAGG